MNEQSAPRIRCKAVSLTHAGRVRDENEDAVYCDPDAGLFILADGMGGHSSGKVASNRAINVIQDYLLNQRYENNFEWPFDPSSKLTELSNHVSIALRVSNVRVYNEAQKNDDLLGMGTTGLIAMVTDEEVVIGHVGDSRCYIHQPDLFQRITNDHSLINQLMRVFGLSEDEASQKAGKNVLVQSIGIEDDITPDVQQMTFSSDMTLLLCSDGLTDMLSEPEIRAILDRPDAQLEGKAKALVDAANNAGGADNISVILVARGD